jgi:hypothetical protein
MCALTLCPKSSTVSGHGDNTHFQGKFIRSPEEINQESRQRLLTILAAPEETFEKTLLQILCPVAKNIDDVDFGSGMSLQGAAEGSLVCPFP